MVLHNIVLALFAAEAAVCLLLCAPLPEAIVKGSPFWQEMETPWRSSRCLHFLPNDLQ